MTTKKKTPKKVKKVPAKKSVSKKRSRAHHRPLEAAEQLFKLTGTMVVTVELEGYKPMAIRVVNDVPLVVKVLRTLIQELGEMSVEVQTPLESAVLQGLVDEAKAVVTD